MPSPESVLFPPRTAPSVLGDAPGPWILDCRGVRLDCRRGVVHVMGILNVTPDSFFDGGAYFSLQSAVDRAGVMVEEGAAIIDVGGESTRPRGTTYGNGAKPVSLSEEVDRVAPIVEAITRALPNCIVSVDTYKGAVARAGLNAGAHMINDVTGGRFGTGVATACADAGAALVVMHSVGRPGEMPHVIASEDVVAEVCASLERSVRMAEDAGVASIAVDAGFGFGKTTAENLRLVAATGRLRALGRPVLVGVSRKQSVGVALGGAADPAPADERLYGSLGLAALAALRGASIVRSHDVAPTVQMLRTIRAGEDASTPDDLRPTRD